MNFVTIPDQYYNTPRHDLTAPLHPTPSATVSTSIHLEKMEIVDKNQNITAINNSQIYNTYRHTVGTYKANLI